MLEELSLVKGGIPSLGQRHRRQAEHIAIIVDAILRLLIACGNVAHVHLSSMILSVRVGNVNIRERELDWHSRRRTWERHVHYRLRIRRHFVCKNIGYGARRAEEEHLISHGR